MWPPRLTAMKRGSTSPDGQPSWWRFTVGQGHPRLYGASRRHTPASEDPRDRRTKNQVSQFATEEVSSSHAAPRLLPAPILFRALCAPRGLQSAHFQQNRASSRSLMEGFGLSKGYTGLRTSYRARSHLASHSLLLGRRASLAAAKDCTRVGQLVDVGAGWSHRNLLVTVPRGPEVAGRRLAASGWSLSRGSSILRFLLAGHRYFAGTCFIIPVFLEMWVGLEQLACGSVEHFHLWRYFCASSSVLFLGLPYQLRPLTCSAAAQRDDNGPKRANEARSGRGAEAADFYLLLPPLFFVTLSEYLYFCFLLN